MAQPTEALEPLHYLKATVLGLINMAFFYN